MNDALDQYRRRAGVYDLELAAFEPIRRSAIARLKLKRGDTVLDVGCGTGLSFDVLQQAIGRRGRIVAIEQCPEMLDQARARVAHAGWTNVTLLQAAVENAPIPCRVDAALFHFTHDILRNPDAVANVVDHLKPGATVVAAGLQWASPWNWAVNSFVMGAALYSVTSFDGLDRPWSLLAEHIGEMHASTELWGGAYIASGVFSG
ncbi:MAG: class I SAM-dependent methyltransferase [Rhodoferax sp.]|nr:class I SAM-dependent methyltransferase [Rhodoferax sp.]